MTNITKFELKKLQGNYGIFDVPTARLEWLFDYEPFPYNELTDIDEVLKTESTKYFRCNEYIAVRGAGKMFTYGYDMVPVSIAVVHSPQSKCNGKVYPKYFSLNAHFTTIDDCAYSLFITINNKKDYIDGMKMINKFLYEYTYMPDKEEFEKYWSKYDNVSICLN